MSENLPSCPTMDGFTGGAMSQVRQALTGSPSQIMACAAQLQQIAQQFISLADQKKAEADRRNKDWPWQLD